MSKALLYLCVALLPLVYGGNDVYVDPIASSCDNFNCTADATAPLAQNLTLDEALAAITSHTTLHLLPGCHCIQRFNFVQHVTDVTLLGEGPTTGVNVTTDVNVTCAQGLGLAFYDLTNLSLKNITVDGCGLSGSNLSTFRHTVERGIDLFVHIHPNYTIAVLCGNCTNLKVEGIMVTNTIGLGFLGINIMGTSVVTASTFSLNSPLEHVLSINISQSDMVGGGALFLYHDYRNDTTFFDSIAKLSFEKSQFTGNLYPGFASIVGLYYLLSETVHDVGYELGGGGGLSVILTQWKYSVSAEVEGCTFRQNTARFGGGVHVEIFTGVSNSNVTFSDCLFEDNGDSNVTQAASPLDTTSGAGLAFIKGFIQPSYDQTPGTVYVKQHPDNLIMTRTVFRHNTAFTGGAVVVLSRYSPFVSLNSDNVLFDSCVFEDNAAFVGAVMYLNEEKNSGSQPGLYYLLDNTTMTNNMLYVNNSVQIQSLDLADSSSVIDGTSVNMTLKDSYFTENSGTVLRTSTSIVHLEGTVVFANNTGTFGGALRLLSSTFLIVRNHSNITFQNNTAEVFGGAIFAYNLNNFPNIAYYDCFLFFDRFDIFCFSSIACANISETGARLSFINNTAQIGGTIYGSTLETCPWAIDILLSRNDTNMSLFEILYNDYHNIFNFEEEPNSIQQVSTDPNKVVIVDKTQDPISILPGEEFHVNVVSLDRFSRVVPAVLSSKIGGQYVHSSVRSTLGLSGYWFTVNDTDTPVTVYGERNLDNVTVTLFTVTSFAQTDFVVNLLNCPDGFVFEKNSCICDRRLDRTDYVSCNSTSKELTVDNTYWVGYGPHGDLVASHCKQEYCNSGPMTFRPPDFDSQCRSGYNRTGIACGECQDGYSIVIATSQCMRCSYRGLFWIPVLGLVGLALIFLICYLRISISGGFLLSVLFYANIVSIYTPSFSAGQSNTNIFVFIAWLNLDLGIISCFYDGMDAVARTGLQLVFPAYLYLLMFVIIFAARRSRRLSIAFSKGGYSAAKLFATLMLMTHTSITRTCLEILGFMEIETYTGHFEVRWQTDPNVPYFSPVRIVLVIIAILLLLFYIIPAPFVLIFPNGVRKLKIFQRLTPIYDAFWAPFKPRYRFWVGLRLLLRGIPILFAFLIPQPSTVVFLGVFLVTFTYIQVMVWPFKTTMLNAIDLFLQYNLLTLVMVTLYFTIFINDSSAKRVNELAKFQFTSFAAIAFVAYLIMSGIFVWHVLARFPKLKARLQNLRQKLWQKLLHTLRHKSHSGSVSLSSSGHTYGSTNPGHTSLNADGLEDSNANLSGSNEESNNRRGVQFSELREPLLDEGELSIDDISPGSTK